LLFFFFFFFFFWKRGKERYNYLYPSPKYNQKKKVYCSYTFFYSDVQ
jgi:hypothetical protein